MKIRYRLLPSLLLLVACGEDPAGNSDGGTQPTTSVCLDANRQEADTCNITAKNGGCSAVENPSCGALSEEAQNVNDGACLLVEITNNCVEDLSGDICVAENEGSEVKWTCIRYGIKAGRTADHRVCNATGDYVAYWTTNPSEPNSVYDLCNPLSGG